MRTSTPQHRGHTQHRGQAHKLRRPERSARNIAVLVMALLVAVVPLVAGCSSGRNVSTPRDALLGHWRNVIPGSGTDVYYSGSSVTYSGKGSSYSVDYTVVSQDQAKFTLFIRLGQKGKTQAAPIQVTFSSDRNTMDLLPTRSPEKLEYKYVDSKQKP
jgi:hypothetical protein